MRILVLQLARYGDIYQTWPSLKAILRQNPGADLHVLVRERFRAAVDGMSGVTAHSFPSADLLEPLLLNENDDESLARLENFVQELSAISFDQIINLSFSPLSSFITSALTQEKTLVRGYTRHSDGTLCIPDDTSAYFYAQVRLGGFNRYHITEIFAAVSGVELVDEDYQAMPRTDVGRQIYVHMGASHASRLYPPELWVKSLSRLADQVDQEIILVGSKAESPLCQTVASQVGRSKVRSIAGQTTLPQLMQQISSARLLIGCDSAPVQIASLTNTPVLHLTSDTANFWTTGPVSAGTRVIYHNELAQIPPDRIATEAIAILEGMPPHGPCALRRTRTSAYEVSSLPQEDFGWKLIEALYTQASYPETCQSEDVLAFQRLFELSELALVQLEKWQTHGVSSSIAEILAQIDSMIEQVGGLNPRVRPVIEWFNTERLRMGPSTADEILARTSKLFSDLRLISEVYRRYQSPVNESERVRELCRGLAPSLREFDIKAISGPFQDLISTLHELSRHSTKVGEQEWSTVLNGLHTALERRDFIEVADQLEYVLVPALS